MINQLRQGKLVSPDSPSYLFRSLPAAARPSGWWVSGVPPRARCPPRGWAGARDGGCERAVSLTPACARVRAPGPRLSCLRLPPGPAGCAFPVKRKKHPLRAVGGGGCERPGLSSLGDSGPRNHVLGLKNRCNSVSFHLSSAFWGFVVLANRSTFSWCFRF